MCVFFTPRNRNGRTEEVKTRGKNFLSDLVRVHDDDDDDDLMIMDRVIMYCYNSVCV